MICPRLYAVRFAQPGPALAAASTALRKSLRVHCGTLAKKSPAASSSGNVRPLSERIKRPPTYGLGVFVIGRRVTVTRRPCLRFKVAGCKGGLAVLIFAP